MAVGGGHGGRGCARAFGHCRVHTQPGSRVKVDPKSDLVWTRATANANTQSAEARVSGGWGRPCTFRGEDWRVVGPSFALPQTADPPHTLPLPLPVPLSAGGGRGHGVGPAPSNPREVQFSGFPSHGSPFPSIRLPNPRGSEIYRSTSKPGSESAAPSSPRTRRGRPHCLRGWFPLPPAPAPACGVQVG